MIPNQDLRGRPPFALAVDQIDAENQSNVGVSLQMEPDTDKAIKKADKSSNF